MEIEFKWNDSLVDEVEKVAIDALQDGAEMIFTDSDDDVPVKTGTLKRSRTISPPVKVDGETTVTLSYNTPYAAAVHEGLDPFEMTITPVNKKVLAVPIKDWNGKPVNPYNSKELPKLSKDGKYVILGKRVNVKHPGFTGRKYLERPLNRNRDKVQKLVGRRVTAYLATKG